MEKETINHLIDTAIHQLKYSYTPYSNFKVGAALLAKNGQVYTGCNIENAGYTATNCAERTAFFKAVSEGDRKFRAIAVAGNTGDYLFPCGVCRQVMMEFCDEAFEIIVARDKSDYKVFTLAELFPGSFSADDLKKI